MLERGRVVRSVAGRDTGYLLAVMQADEKRVLVCDGKERRLEKPKQKNPLHIAPSKTVLDAEAMATNRSLKKALAILESKGDQT